MKKITAIFAFFVLCILLSQSVKADKTSRTEAELCGEEKYKYAEEYNYAEEYGDANADGDGEDLGGDIELPQEYGELLDSLPDGVLDALPEEAFGDSAEEIMEAAREASSPTRLLGILLEGFGAKLRSLLPMLALFMGITVLSSAANTVALSLSPSLSSAVSLCTRLCSFSGIAMLSVSALSRVEEYFNALCASVAAFIPLGGVLYAMGGNITGATASTLNTSVVLTVCQYVCCETVIPVFCLCLSLSLLSVFDGTGATVSSRLGANVKKWYSTAIGAAAMLLVASLASQSVIAAKADNLAMRGARFAVGSFIPVSGGTLATTLGTLAGSVELLRSSVGIIGIVIIFLLLLPVIIELALIRAICSLSSFLAGMLNLSGEQRLFDEISTLYGYLEGIAALSAAIFIIALAIFATSSTPFS